MSYIKQQYDYSQIFNYKQITEKTAQSVSILRYIKLILMLHLSTIWQWQ